MSTLGRIVFLEEGPPSPKDTKKFKILVWKFDPFDKCSVKNCEITYKSDDISSADIVVFHMQMMKALKDLPPEGSRNPDQIWTFVTDESPIHTFKDEINNLKDYNNVFNWSMTYSYKSDIPVPYGRTVLLKQPNISNVGGVSTWNRTKFGAILLLHCKSPSQRLNYVNTLTKYIPIEMYGKCGTLKCPGRYDTDREALNQYKFYFAFENSNCDEYMTEKLFWHGYSKNTLPVIMGSPEGTLAKLLPPNSYINAFNFAGPRELGLYLKYVGENFDVFQTFFTWKKYYAVLQEHGYYKSDSVHYCRVCEALNYNVRERKIYDDLESFWSAKSCHTTNYPVDNM